MTPEEILLNLTLQGCKSVLGKDRQPGMEYAMFDILQYCRDRKRNQFGTISLPQLIAYFKHDSKLDVPSAMKLKGLTGLLEAGYLRRFNDFALIRPKFKRVCIKQITVTIKEVPTPVPEGTKTFSAHQ